VDLLAAIHSVARSQSARTPSYPHAMWRAGSDMMSTIRRALTPRNSAEPSSKTMSEDVRSMSPGSLVRPLAPLLEHFDEVAADVCSNDPTADRRDGGSDEVQQSEYEEEEEENANGAAESEVHPHSDIEMKDRENEYETQFNEEGEAAKFRDAGKADKAVSARSADVGMVVYDTNESSADLDTDENLEAEQNGKNSEADEAGEAGLFSSPGDTDEAGDRGNTDDDEHGGKNADSDKDCDEEEAENDGNGSDNDAVEKDDAVEKGGALEVDKSVEYNKEDEGGGDDDDDEEAAEEAAGEGVGQAAAAALAATESARITYSRARGEISLSQRLFAPSRSQLPIVMIAGSEEVQMPSKPDKAIRPTRIATGQALDTDRHTERSRAREQSSPKTSSKKVYQPDDAAMWDVPSSSLPRAAKRHGSARRAGLRNQIAQGILKKSNQHAGHNEFSNVPPAPLSRTADRHDLTIYNMPSQQNQPSVATSHARAIQTDCNALSDAPLTLLTRAARRRVNAAKSKAQAAPKSVKPVRREPLVKSPMTLRGNSRTSRASGQKSAKDAEAFDDDRAEGEEKWEEVADSMEADPLNPTICHAGAKDSGIDGTIAVVNDDHAHHAKANDMDVKKSQTAKSADRPSAGDSTSSRRPPRRSRAGGFLAYETTRISDADAARNAAEPDKAKSVENRKMTVADDADAIHDSPRSHSDGVIDDAPSRAKRRSKVLSLSKPTCDAQGNTMAFRTHIRSSISNGSRIDAANQTGLNIRRYRNRNRENDGDCAGDIDDGDREHADGNVENAGDEDFDTDCSDEELESETMEPTPEEQISSLFSLPAPPSTNAMYGDAVKRSARIAMQFHIGMSMHSRQELARRIVINGGRVVAIRGRNCDERPTYPLVNANLKAAKPGSRHAYKDTYIDECIKQNKLLDPEIYRLGKRADLRGLAKVCAIADVTEEAAGYSADSSSDYNMEDKDDRAIRCDPFDTKIVGSPAANRIVAKTRPRRPSTLFSPQDDEKLLAFAKKYCHGVRKKYGAAGTSRKMWNRAAKRNIIGRPVTGIALRNRFLFYLRKDYPELFPAGGDVSSPLPHPADRKKKKRLQTLVPPMFDDDDDEVDLEMEAIQREIASKIKRERPHVKEIMVVKSADRDRVRSPIGKKNMNVSASVKATVCALAKEAGVSKRKAFVALRLAHGSYNKALTSLSFDYML
jgi:BRCT domain, a BRCA1 C-terminus domain